MSVTAAASVSDAFAAHFVCTGNRARSAAAAALFEKHTRGLDVVVGSFGTLEGSALPALPSAVEAARRYGVDLSSHRSRPLRPGVLATSDLVIGFEPAHVAAAVVDGGADIGRTFILGELADKLEEAIDESDPLIRARWAVAIADSRRVRTRPDPTLSIGDPYGQPDEVMERTVDEIDRLVRRLAQRLFGIPEPSLERPAWT